MLPQAGTDLLDRRQVKRIVGTVARYHLCGYRHPHRIQRREHHLELRQVRAVIFTVSQLEQAFFIHAPIAIDGGTIQSHPLRLKMVHPYHALGQGRFQPLPLLVIAQRIQHQGQARSSLQERSQTACPVQVCKVCTLCSTQGCTWFIR